jgi:micrococcal nuclease
MNLEKQGAFIKSVIFLTSMIRQATKEKIVKISRIFKIAALSAMIGIFPCAASAWDAEVVAVPDGDSLKVRSQAREYKVRLYGIDSPEFGQDNWQEARSLTRSLVAGRRVALETMDKDQYGRIVALVYSGDVLVNRELVRNGQAWLYPRYCRSEPLCTEMRGLEMDARRQQKGLWRETSPLPPWKWKRLHPHDGERRRR